MAFLWRAAGPAQALAKYRIRLTVKRTERKAFILSTLDSFRAVCRSPSDFFPVPANSTKRNIYKYFVTKNFPFTRQHTLDTLSSASWQSISQLPSFPAIFEDMLPSRLSAPPGTHHPGNSTENRLCLPVAVRLFIPCNVFRYLFHTLVWMLFKHREKFLCATSSDCVWEQNYLLRKIILHYFANYLHILHTKFTWRFSLNFCPDGIFCNNIANNFFFINSIAFVCLLRFLNNFHFSLLFTFFELLLALRMASNDLRVIKDTQHQCVCK